MEDKIIYSNKIINKQIWEEITMQEHNNKFKGI